MNIVINEFELDEEFKNELIAILQFPTNNTHNKLIEFLILDHVQSYKKIIKLKEQLSYFETKKPTIKKPIITCTSDSPQIISNISAESEMDELLTSLENIAQSKKPNQKKLKHTRKISDNFDNILESYNQQVLVKEIKKNRQSPVALQTPKKKKPKKNSNKRKNAMNSILFSPKQS
jgi:hypothetical protein